VNWVIDTQLPHQLSTALKKRGQHAVHASELQAGHLSSDQAIVEHAERISAVVVTKDADFLASYEVHGTPKRLVYVSTGNIRNSELILLFMHFLDLMCEQLATGGLLELERDALIER
jgi:predicted nuclease of predicted toxin-antitoxin system